MLKTLLVVKMSMNPNKQQSILLPGRIGPPQMLSIKSLISVFTVLMLFFLPLLCHVLEGLVEFLLLSNTCFYNQCWDSFPCTLLKYWQIVSDVWRAVGAVVVKSIDLLYHNAFRCLFGQFIPIILPSLPHFPLTNSTTLYKLFNFSKSPFSLL